MATPQISPVYVFEDYRGNSARVWAQVNPMKALGTLLANLDLRSFAISADSICVEVNAVSRAVDHEPERNCNMHCMFCRDLP